MPSGWRDVLVGASDHSEHIHWAMRNGGSVAGPLIGPALDLDMPSDEDED